MKPGDKAICVNDDNLYTIPVRSICKGLVYTIMEVFECKCGNVYIRLAEVNKKFNMWCPKCDTFEYCLMYFHIERFRLMEGNEAEEKETIKQENPVLNICPVKG